MEVKAMKVINGLKYWGQLLFLPIYWLSFLIPRDKKLWLFGSTFGRRFADNPKYFYLYLSQRKESLGIRPIWITHEQKIVELLENNGYEAYYCYSLKGIWYACRGKVYLFDNYSKDINFWLSGGAIKINLWHGVGNKRINYDNQHDKVRHPKNILEKIRYFPRRLSDEKPNHYILATSPMMCRIFARAFQVSKGHVIEAGYPRNDYILGEEIENVFSREERKAFNQIHKWKSAGKKVVMYMPTFRESEVLFSSVMDMENFNRFLSQNNILFLTKLHPKSKLKREFGQQVFENILNLNADMDSYIFLKQADVLVTDYSSVYSDYMLLDRPVIAFWYDYKEYTENTRDSYFDFDKYMPEIRAKNFEELKKALECALSEDICKEARSRSREKMFSSLEGDACSKLTGKINRILAGDL
ncbi:hypothetical protein D7V86_01870 [bacterium D16-51]|nr:hypothetical protein D7V96_01295 [bacterium D16-59]RKI62291.1 hypothetical protein D7V86_01870 [bacterium D16-51]